MIESSFDSDKCVDQVSFVESSDDPKPVLTLSDVKSIGQQWPPIDLPQSTYELLARSAEENAERVAISYFASVSEHEQTRKLNYREFFQGVTRTANLLHHLGIGEGDVVALLLPNLPETHMALWGAEAVGVVMPLNPFLESKAISALLSAAQAKLLITFGNDPELIDKVLEALGVASTIKNVVLISSDKTSAREELQSRLATMPNQIKVHDFTECFLKAPMDRLVNKRKISRDDVSSYFCTGGTTGLPKIAVRTHGQTIANAWMVRHMLSPALNKESILFCGLPLFHVNAVMLTGLAPFSIGASVLIGTPQGYRTKDLISRFWQIVEHHRVTAFSAVPTLLASLLEYPSYDFDLSSFRFAICAASPLSAELLHRFEQTCQISISEAYGMTEASCGASFNPIDGEHRPGSVGLPLPTQDIQPMLLDAKGNYLRDAQVGEIGVVGIAGPNIFSGYLEASHNKSAWIDRGDGRKWVNSGDLGKMDSDGYLWLTGRAKDLIIRGGHNIDPSVIEEALYAHSAVALAAAVGRPDARLGELPVAYVQLRHEISVSEADLIAFVANIIGERAAIPKYITVLDALPLTSVGKIHKPTLRNMESLSVSRIVIKDANIEHAIADLVEDGIGGSIVRIQANKADECRIQDALKLFTFPYQINPIV